MVEIRFNTVYISVYISQIMGVEELERREDDRDGDSDVLG